jgi:hypothetical protein
MPTAFRIRPSGEVSTPAGAELQGELRCAGLSSQWLLAFENDDHVLSGRIQGDRLLD